MTSLISRHRRHHHGGFTLIELLVVIVILGILAAVVVFAVRGVGGKGRTEAVSVDARTVRTALEVYCAQKGHYPPEPAMQTLVDERFLSSPSQYNVLHTGDSLGEGNCPDTPKHFSLTGIPPAQPPAGPVGKWFTKPPADLPVTISGAHMVTLSDGRIFLAGGSVGAPTAQFYDVATKGWLPTTPPPPPYLPQNMVAIPGSSTTACPNCGKVLVHSITYTGGEGWHLFDPGAQVWTQLPGAAYACGQGLSLTVLGDDSVLVAGCANDGVSQEAGMSAQVFDPTKDVLVSANQVSPWKTKSSMLYPHGRPLAVRLAGGQVLVVGGGGPPPCYVGCVLDDTPTYRRAEIYDPSQDRWTDAGSAVDGHFDNDYGPATLLADGRVLLIASSGHAELYDPQSGGSWSPAGSAWPAPLGDDRHSATLLTSGKVLAVTYSSSSLFDPATNDPATNGWAPTAPRPTGPEVYGAAARLSGGSCGADCGKVVVAGNDSYNTPTYGTTSTLMFSESGSPPGTP